MASDAIALDDLTLGYEGHPAIHHLQGSFASGSLTAIVGPNGSGKSTLLKGIAGILHPIGGTIEIIGPGDPDLAYLPQSADIDRRFPASVTDLVALGFWRRRGPFSAITSADRNQLQQALVAVGLTGFEKRPIDTLSGGQMQRALFARLIVQNASIILLDEPFAAIDEKTIIDLMELIARWHAEGKTILAVLHNLAAVRKSFPQTLLLAREQIAWGPTASALSPANLHRARGMNEAWDEHAPWHEGHQRHDEHEGHETP